MPELPFPFVSWPSFAIACGAALVIAVIIAAIVTVPVRLLARRRDWDNALVGRVRWPFRVLLLVVGLWVAVQLTLPMREAVPALVHAARILTIASTAWLLAGAVTFASSGVLRRYRTDVADNRLARRVHTQVAILRRIVVVVIVIVGLGGILLTFPGVEAVGASLLASAGLASVVAGLAAQSTLANVFAGIQLAFSDAIRVEDVVVVEGEWGRIEEITLTYVVVHIWDDRRLVLPSTYFTSTPFQNWTRRNSELLGAVELDLDWRVPPGAMRDELDRILDGTELWDGRAKVLQVTDAVGGTVRIRVLVTAKDAPTLFDLRCLVRERLVDWVQRETPAGLPVQRVELVPQQTGEARRREPSTDTGGLFTGSAEAEQRAHTFTTSVPVQRG